MASDHDLILIGAHVLGGGDVSRAATLANPSALDSLELITRLRQRRAGAWRRRVELAASARAAYTVGSAEKAASLTKELRGIDRELAQVESAIDQMCQFLRPGSDRRAPRRTRDASLAIARQRLEAVRRLFVDAGVASDRIELRTPTFGSPTGEISEMTIRA